MRLIWFYTLEQEFVLLKELQPYRAGVLYFVHDQYVEVYNRRDRYKCTLLNISCACYYGYCTIYN